MIIWLIGMSGAGKSTVGRSLATELRARRPGLVYLDGDQLREVWGDQPGHDIAGRAINAGRISRLCAMLDQQGIDVIAAVLSIFPDWQAWNRATFTDYREIFLDAPMEVLRARDTKGLYAAADAGEQTNVVGVDIAFPRPLAPDLILDSSGRSGGPHVLVNAILDHVLEPR